MSFIKEWSGVVALVIVVFTVVATPKTLEKGFGAAGGMLLEDYFPYVMYNDGIKTQKNLVLSGTSATLAVGGTLTATGATTLSSTLALSGVASLTGEGNKIGSASSVNYTYYGAGDGCTAVFFTSSSTQVTQATSTSFCNS